MMPALFGLDLPGGDQIGQWVLRILAVAGAAAVGGLTIGLITQGLSRLLTTRPVPRIPLNIVRVLGAIVCGWLAALLLFGGGPGGIGGGGGWSLFGGAGGGGSTGKETATTAREGGTGRESGPRETGKSGPTDGLTLEVEVLPRSPALYRVQAPGKSARELDFDHLTDYLLEQKKATPAVTAIQVSPGLSDPRAPAVTRIIDWARDKGGLRVVNPPRPGD
jgi:hypothetical protein